MSKDWLTTILPFAVLALVMALRWRNVKRARPFKPGRLWIAPALYLVLVGFVLIAMPPSAAGWLAFATGVLIGAALGWQRGKLMHLEHDGQGQLMIRTSPAALVVIILVVGAKRIFAPAARGGATGAPALAPQALLFTDALLGFALGMIVAMRIELWLRARRMGAVREGN
ncbi:MAG TPA: DUF1453 family protein [Novosphingobium sp.]|nr:DUF1453 family protein [Novosphingobium sp.]